MRQPASLLAMAIALMVAFVTIDAARAHPTLPIGVAELAGDVHRTQAGPIAGQRDCQTVRTCDFRRSSRVRGCLSSYSCRVCRWVSGDCRWSNGRRVCRSMRCSWGG